MRQFRWLYSEEIPPDCDLRRCGWTLSSDRYAGGDRDACVTIGHYARMDLTYWTRFLLDHDAARRPRVLLLGVNDSDERARLLRIGFGEVLGDTAGLGEIEARAAAVSARSELVARRREVGGLKLDLIAREAFAGARPLGLHPREFALAWRLADNPGAPVTKRTLLRDVWRLGHVPETNSLAVHVSRLRDKLRAAGLSWMVATTIDGGYVLLTEQPQAYATERAEPLRRQAAPAQSAADARSRMAGAIRDTVDDA